MEMAWAVLWRRCVLLSPIAGCVQSLRAPLLLLLLLLLLLQGFGSGSEARGGVGVEQQEEEGDVIEGWNRAIPQGAPTSLSPSSLLFNPGDPLGRQGL